MQLQKYILTLVGCLAAVVGVHAERWTTHFAYNNVTQIAMSSERVYAISDGSLYSVDKQTEAIRVYSRQSGLNGTNITCIYYDETGEQLVIGYETGKIDILSERGVKYISELYDKDMTQRKTIYNVTLKGRTAYLSTHYGVQTLDLRENKLVDSYWLRPGGQETPVKDVLLKGDSIYAFTDDSVFCAAMSDNLVDYTFWKREQRSGRVSPDPDKGWHYQDATNHWYAGHAEGIVRFTATERLTYKPQGPIVNKPYYISAVGNQLFLLAGGRWTTQNGTPGHVMRYVDGSWHNIHADSIRSITGVRAYDMMNVAVDPQQANHYYVTSYGTGLYEFNGDQCISHTLANDVIETVIPDDPAHYTRLLGAKYDETGRLWFLDAGVSHPVLIKEGNTYHRLPLVVNGQPLSIEMPCDLLIDRQQPNHKWIGIAYKQPGLVLLNDNGTPTEATDDKAFYRGEWTNQHGHTFKPEDVFAMMQDRQGRVWIATEQGAAYIDANTDFITSDAIVQPDVTDNNGENPITTLRMKALCQTPDGHIWIGSESLGVYELNEEATEILRHFTTDNSAMSANGILSLTCNTEGHLFIGTSEGLVEYDPNGQGEGMNGATEEGQQEMDEGSMQRWRLHFSYTNPSEIAATPRHIFAAANGSLFSVDRTDEAIVYWNKATGLSGTSVKHIAYDAQAGKLIIAYENGQMDLLDDDGSVTPMPDISMRAGSIATTINSICVGSRQTYLAMPFGIIAVNTRKGEVSDTYYIGSEAASVEVQHVVELGDSIYAFSYDKLYKAALNDNLVDYTYWKSEPLPFEQVQQVAVHNRQMYALYDRTLHRRNGGAWKQVVTNSLEWIHTSGAQLLTYEKNIGLFFLTDEDGLNGLSATYVATDAIYSNGEYWLAEESKGLVRLGNKGDDFFQPEGPLSNFGYHLDIAHDRVYVAPGGRWAEQFGRQSSLSIYDGQEWKGIPWPDTWYYTGHDIRDAVSYAVDNSDPGHFYVATYGTGLFEFKNYKAVQHFDSVNSTLRKAAPNTKDYYFTRTDGAMMDEQGNLWVMNATTTGKPLHVLAPTGQWFGLRLRSGSTDLTIETPTGIWVDQRNKQWKWMFSQRGEPRVILLDDGGTPTLNGDDRCVARSSFYDQNGNTLSPSQFRCFAQDHTNRVWIGTEKGVILIPKEVDFFTSNACRRIIIPRNDGTGLGDYLLGDEQINCMAVDGGNRMWIGTANSGLYLIEDDTITVAHFTETNSLLPSNSIQSIAILPKTGEVFVGTDRGIASYRSDASEAQADMSHAYAFPNPVRPDYGGFISITGLMDNTVVNIVDASGNLVCKTRSHGGTAIWDGKLPDGRRATPGVYTALCNAQDGHTVVKILVAY